MMPAVVVTPVVVTPVVMAPMAVVTDAPRSEMRPYHGAAAVSVVIRVIVVVGVVRRPIEEMPMKAVVPEREAAVANAAAVEHRRASNRATVEYGSTTPDAAAVKGCAAASTVETASPNHVATATAAATATMAATDFGRQSFGCMFTRGYRTRIDQRQRLCALAWCGRQRKQRGHRKPQGTDNATGHAAPRIWNIYHAWTSLN